MSKQNVSYVVTYKWQIHDGALELSGTSTITGSNLSDPMTKQQWDGLVQNIKANLIVQPYVTEGFAKQRAQTGSHATSSAPNVVSVNPIFIYRLADEPEVVSANETKVT